jgi:peptide-methionine (S)-S-oxide reductase
LPLRSLDVLSACHVDLNADIEDQAVRDYDVIVNWSALLKKWEEIVTGLMRNTSLAVVLLALSALLLTRITPVTAEQARVVPPPAVDEAPGQAASEVAVLAGGCFWGVQGVFQHVTGVTSAVSGYAGGDPRVANYDAVSTGVTGHAESVQVTFDPRVITFGRLLQIYFSVVHDPTELNRQGPDSGTEYRSTIFPANAEQARVAAAYITQLNAAKVFKRKIVTTMENGRTFTPAERYHQDFLTNHPSYPYIAINDMPKLEDLKRLFPHAYRTTPVLVLSGKTAT